jgi:DNA-binding transcriptional LysR family regulator
VPAPADSIDDLVLLAAVVEAGGFSAASARTGIPKSRLSRRIAALEQRLGVPLLQRDSRHFEVTETGRQMAEQGARIRDGAEAAWAIARDSRGEPSGHLSVACPVAMAATLLAPFVAEFARDHARVRLSIHTTTGMVETLAERHDIVIHPAAVPLPDSRMVARRLYLAPFALVRAPSATPAPREPQELAACDLLGWDYMGPQQRWRLVHEDGREVEVPVAPRLVCDNLLVLQNAVRAGWGIAPMSTLMCRADVAAGKLEIVLPGWSPPPATMYAVYLSRNALSLAGRLFIDRLAAHLQKVYG